MNIRDEIIKTNTDILLDRLNWIEEFKSKNHFKKNYTCNIAGLKFDLELDTVLGLLTNIEKDTYYELYILSMEKETKNV